MSQSRRLQRAPGRFGCFYAAKMKVAKGSDFLNAMLRLCFETLQLVSQVFFHFRYRKRGKSMPPIDDPLLLNSATILAGKIRKREVTSVQVVEAFMRRIIQTNPDFNAVVDVRFQKALQEAREIDAEISRGMKTEEEIKKETPLLGVPFTFKSSISCRGMRHTAGLVSRKCCIATEDADVVVLMKKAGAIPLASTNVSEMCAWWESYNAVHGRTNNPYDSNRSAGGSSGGEGCIQSFGGSPVGLGSDVGGSIRIPAQLNGIFGHKPTNGSTSTRGHFPFPRNPSLRPFLVIGPMSRYASDLQPILKIISPNLELSKPDLKNLRCFYMDSDLDSPIVSRLEPGVKSGVQRVVAYLKTTHGMTAERVNMERMQHAMLIWHARMTTKEGPMMAKTLANFRGSKNLFWELFLFLFGGRSHTFPVLVTAVLEKIGMRFGDSQHLFYMKECEELKKEFELLLGPDGVFICPTLPTTAFYHSQPSTRPFDISFAAAFNCLGFPATHCPLGLGPEGLPLGIQVVALEGKDGHCLAVAEALDRGLGGWTPPKE